MVLATGVYQPKVIGALVFVELVKLTERILGPGGRSESARHLEWLDSNIRFSTTFVYAITESGTRIGHFPMGEIADHSQLFLFYVKSSGHPDDIWTLAITSFDELGPIEPLPWAEWEARGLR
jgi:hypothetical protein